MSTCALAEDKGRAGGGELTPRRAVGSAVVGGEGEGGKGGNSRQQSQRGASTRRTELEAVQSADGWTSSARTLRGRSGASAEIGRKIW